MKAKFISEEIYTKFERGKSPEQIKSSLSGRVTYEKFLDILSEESNWEKLEEFVNEYIIDKVERSEPNFIERSNLDDLKKAMNILMNEALDNSIEEKYNSEEEEDES